MKLSSPRHLVLGGLAALVLGGSALAGPNPYLGQVIPVGENFCPRGYLPAHGQLLPIAQNTALFSLVGCAYGGDCRSTFALPDLRGRAMIGAGSAPGLPTYTRGEIGGAPTRTLTQSQMPQHIHALRGSTNAPATNSPANNAMSTYTSAAQEIYSDQDPGSAMLNPLTLSNAGGSQSFSLYQPSIAVNFCIATVGLYPPRG